MPPQILALPWNLLRRLSRSLLRILSLTIISGLMAHGQTRPLTPSGNLTVSPAEVGAFMQSFQKDPKAMLAIESNPRRVPLLLGALKRDPTGPWAGFLLGFCFQADRAATWDAPEPRRAAVYARAIEYLSAAKATLVQALSAQPENAQLKHSLARVDQALNQARAESAAPPKKLPPPAALPGSNAPASVEARAPKDAAPPKSPAQLCGRNLAQIQLAKQMWRNDNNNSPPNATPNVANLVRYFPYREFPQCPERGTYSIGKLNEQPRCSFAGHHLPDSAKKEPGKGSL